MPKMAYSAPSENLALQRAIRDGVRELVEKGNEEQDALERIQWHLGQINNKNNLKPGELVT